MIWKHFVYTRFYALYRQTQIWILDFTLLIKDLIFWKLIFEGLTLVGLKLTNLRHSFCYVVESFISYFSDFLCAKMGTFHRIQRIVLKCITTTIASDYCTWCNGYTLTWQKISIIKIIDRMIVSEAEYALR